MPPYLLQKRLGGFTLCKRAFRRRLRTLVWGDAMGSLPKGLVWHDEILRFVTLGGEQGLLFISWLRQQYSVAKARASPDNVNDGAISPGNLTECKDANKACFRVTNMTYIELFGSRRSL